MRYQVYDPESAEVLLSTNNRYDALDYAALVSGTLRHNMGLKDNLALAGEVDLWTINQRGETQPVTVKH